MYETLKTNNHTHQGVQFFSSLLEATKLSTSHIGSRQHTPRIHTSKSPTKNIHHGCTKVNHRQNYTRKDAPTLQTDFLCCGLFWLWNGLAGCKKFKNSCRWKEIIERIFSIFWYQVAQTSFFNLEHHSLAM